MKAEINCTVYFKASASHSEVSHPFLQLSVSQFQEQIRLQTCLFGADEAGGFTAELGELLKYFSHFKNVPQLSTASCESGLTFKEKSMEGLYELP